MSAFPKDYSSVSDSIVINVESKQNVLEAVMPTASPQQYTPYTGRMDRSLEVNKERHLDFESRYTDSESLRMDEAFCYAGLPHTQNSEQCYGLSPDSHSFCYTPGFGYSNTWDPWNEIHQSSLSEGYLDTSARSTMASGNAWTMQNGSHFFSLSDYSPWNPQKISKSPVSSETMNMQSDYGTPPTATTMYSLIEHSRSTDFESSITPSADSGYDSLSNYSTSTVFTPPPPNRAPASLSYGSTGARMRRNRAMSGAGYAVPSSTTSRDTQQKHSSTEDDPGRSLGLHRIVKGKNQNTDLLTITSETFPGRPGMLGDHLAITTQQISLENFPDTIENLDLAMESDDTKEKARSILNLGPYRRAQTDVAHVSNYPKEMTITETDTEECDDNEFESSDNPEDIYAYSSAFRYFGLLASPGQSQFPEIQDSPDGVHSTSSISGSISSTSPYTNSLTSFGSGSGSITATGSSNCGKGSSDGSVVAVFNRSRGVSGQKPLELLCWHAAIGLKCKGAVGRNTSARRLYIDHSFTAKSTNTHRLSPPCGRCKLLFPDSATAMDHETILQSDVPCPRLDPGEVTRRNNVLGRSGISREKDAAIKKALQRFRSGNKKRSEEHSLPGGCNREHFREWVLSNTALYIGESNTTQEDAAKELSHWYIYFCVLFPERRIPVNPFEESSEARYCRLLELLNKGLEDAANNGEILRLTTQQTEKLECVFNRSIEVVERELLEEKSRAGSRIRSRKRPRSEDQTPGESPIPSTPNPPTMTAARKKRLKAEYGAAGVLTAPSPGSMGPPPSPSPALFDPATLDVPPETHQPGAIYLDQSNDILDSAEDMRVLFDPDYLG